MNERAPLERPASRVTCRAASVSRQGTGRRENQDATLIDSDKRLFVIADGVGGRQGSGLASAMACCQLLDGFEDSLPTDCSLQRHARILAGLKRAFQQTEYHILHEQQIDDHLRHMASTALLAFVDDKADGGRQGAGRLYVANLGDSRLLLIRDGVERQLTEEHRIAQGLCDAGLISCEEARRHPEYKTLYLHLGGSLHDGPDICWMDLQSGDQLVLMTDGIWSQFANAEIAEIVSSSGTEKIAAAGLARLARKRGSRDDVSCVVVTMYHQRPPETAASAPRFDPPSAAELFSTAH